MLYQSSFSLLFGSARPVPSLVEVEVEVPESTGVGFLLGFYKRPSHHLSQVASRQPLIKGACDGKGVQLLRYDSKTQNRRVKFCILPGVSPMGKGSSLMHQIVLFASVLRPMQRKLNLRPRGYKGRKPGGKREDWCGEPGERKLDNAMSRESDGDIATMWRRCPC